MLKDNTAENAEFIENLSKTQLFILYVEEYYDINP